MNNSTKSLIIGLVALVGIAITGFALYSMQIPTQDGEVAVVTPRTPPPPAIEPDVTANPASSTTKPDVTTATPKDAVASKATIEEVRKIISTITLHQATPEALKQYSADMAKIMVDSPSFDITSCVATPNVFHVTLNRKVKVTNSDIVSHEIMYGKQKVTIAASSQKEVMLPFTGPGIYAFLCDGRDFAGAFLVTP